MTHTSDPNEPKAFACGYTKPNPGAIASKDLVKTTRSPSTMTPVTSLFEVTWRSRWIIAGITLLSLAAAFVYLHMAVPLYTGKSRIYVEQLGPKVLENPMQIRQSDSYLYTQAELIKSYPILIMAIESLGGKRLKSFRAIDNPIEFLKKYMEVTVGKKDDIIDVTLALPDPKEAAQVVNGVVDAYITKYAEQKRSTTVEVLKILQSEKEKRDSEQKQTREALQNFCQENPYLTAQDDRGSNIYTRQLSLLSDDLTKAQLDLIQAKEKYDSFIAMRADPRQKATLIEGAIARNAITLDTFLDQQVHVLELNMATESKKFDEGHPKVKEIKEPLEKLRKEAAKLKSQVCDSYLDALHQELKQQWDLARSKLESLQQQYTAQLKLTAETNSKSFDFLMLQENSRRTDKLCDVINDRIKELNVSEEAGALNISLIEAAQPNEIPTSPRRTRILGLGMIAGLMFGFVLALLREFFDHRLRSIEQITALLELPLLGVLPHLKGKNCRATTGQMVANRPRSEIAEAFRTLRTSIYFGLKDRRAKTILVTSPSPGDGKSTVASNLAIAMAQADQSVLLVEADFRKPKQKDIFELQAEIGLTDVLTNHETLEAAITKTELSGLSILPCGSIPLNPVEIVNSQAFRQALEELSRRYDKIIIDAPPVMPVADARILCALCDITILVIRAEKSTHRHSLGARDELRSVGGNILGVVVNSAPTGTGRNGYGRYGYGSYIMEGFADKFYKFDYDPNRTQNVDNIGSSSKEKLLHTSDS